MRNGRVLGWLVASAVALGAKVALACACSGGASGSWPPAGTRLPLNPQLVFWGRGSGEAELLRSLSKARLELVSAVDAVLLEKVPVRTRLEAGQSRRPTAPTRPYDVAFLTLKPTRALAPNQEYQLTVNGKPSKGYGLADALSWPTSECADQVAPRWNAGPFVEKAKATNTICGTHVGATVQAQVTDDGHPVLLRLEMGAGTEEIAEGEVGFVGFEKDGTVALEDSFCHPGPFPLTVAEPMVVSVTALDLAGNAVRSPASLDFEVERDPCPNSYALWQREYGQGTQLQRCQRLLAKGTRVNVRVFIDQKGAVERFDFDGKQVSASFERCVRRESRSMRLWGRDPRCRDIEPLRSFLLVGPEP